MAAPKIYQKKTSRHRPRCEVCGSRLYFRKRHRDWVCLNPLCPRFYHLQELTRDLKRILNNKP